MATRAVMVALLAAGACFAGCSSGRYEALSPPGARPPGIGEASEVLNQAAAIHFFPPLKHGVYSDGPTFAVDGTRMDVLSESDDRVVSSYYLPASVLSEYQQKLPALVNQEAIGAHMIGALPRARVDSRDGRSACVYATFQKESGRFNDAEFDAMYRLLGAVAK